MTVGSFQFIQIRDVAFYYFLLVGHETKLST